MLVTTVAPRGIATPHTSVSMVAVRDSVSRGGSRRSPSSTAAGTRARSARSRSSRMGSRSRPAHEVGRRPVGRLGARRQEEAHEGEDLLVGEPAVVVLGAGQDRDEVVARGAAPVGDERQQVAA